MIKANTLRMAEPARFFHSQPFVVGKIPCCDFQIWPFPSSCYSYWLCAFCRLWALQGHVFTHELLQATPGAVSVSIFQDRFSEGLLLTVTERALSVLLDATLCTDEQTALPSFLASCKECKLQLLSSCRSLCVASCSLSWALWQVNYLSLC